MTYLRSLLGTLAFRASALCVLAEKHAILAGIACFSAGFLTYVSVRKVVQTYALNAIYASTPEPDIVEISLSGLFVTLAQTLLFFLLVYVPGIILLSSFISGDSLGFYVPRDQYRAHISALFPLWGLIFLVSAPLQWYVLAEPVGFGVGQLVLVILMSAYSIWAIRELNYLSLGAGLGVFALSWLTLPVFYVLTTFLFALPFFILIPVAYLGWQRLRTFGSARAGERDFQHHLHTLTLNPQDADAHHQMGLIHLKRRNLDAAQRCFSAAMKIDPKDPDYHYSLGRVFELRGDWPHALESYEETYRLNAEFGLGDIFREVGKGYLHTDRLEKAMEFLKFFLETRGSDPEGRYWLAVTFRRRGDLANMAAQLKTILEQAHSNPKFFRRENREWIYRARVLLRQTRS